MPPRTPFDLVRLFHPKVTAYTVHKDMSTDDIMTNRDRVGKGPVPMSKMCQDVCVDLLSRLTPYFPTIITYILSL